jgi:HPt (histidine-containing phosphotransfer) domain-containing protein
MYELMGNAADSIPADATPQRATAVATRKNDAALIDEKALNQLIEMDVDSLFLTDIVQTFTRDGNTLLDKLDLFTKDKYQSFQDTAHALKGNAGNLGAVGLYAACKAAENISLMEYQHHASTHVNTIRELFYRTVFQLNQALHKQHNIRKAKKL